MELVTIGPETADGPAEEVMVSSRDGIRLATDIYLPPAARRHPTVLVRLPYDKRGRYTFMPQLAPWFTDRGYVFVVQDVRGKFRSEGNTVPYIAEAADGYDTLEWITQQPWSDGTVGMFGDSYYGVTQWAAVASGHPALRAIVPRVTSADLGAIRIGTWWDEGVPPLYGADYFAHYWVDRLIYDYQVDWAHRPLAGARRWPCARLVPAVVAQSPPHLGQPGQLATAAQGPVEEVQGGAEVDRDQVLQGGVIGVVVGRGADGDVCQLVVLMVRGVGDEVLPGRLTRPAAQRGVVPHGVRHDVVEPAHRVQHRDADLVERVPGGVVVEGHPSEHHVNRGRAGPDLPEGLVEGACERPVCPVHRVFVDEPVHPVVREVVGAVQRRHSLVPPGPDSDGPQIRAGHPGDDGPQRRMPAGRRGPLRDPVIGVSEHSDGAVRPGLAHDPFDRVVAVVDLVDVGNRLSLGTELAPDVLDHEHVATLGEPGRQLWHEGVPPALVVGEADEHGRVAVPRRQVDVGGQAHAVPGRHHDLVGQGVDRRRLDGHKVNRH